MEVNLNPETEQKLKDLASRMQCETGDLLREAVENLLSYNDWFEDKVRKGIASADRGDIVSNEEVLAWIESRKRSAGGN